jgi:hypothetical protein
MGQKRELKVDPIRPNQRGAVHLHRGNVNHGGGPRRSR